MARVSEFCRECFPITNMKQKTCSCFYTHSKFSPFLEETVMIVLIWIMQISSFPQYFVNRIHCEVIGTCPFIRRSCTVHLVIIKMEITSLVHFSLTLSLPSIKGIFSQLFKEKCVSYVVWIGSVILFYLSKLWKAKFSILCDEIFLVRLQGKFDIDHSWEWKWKVGRMIFLILQQEGQVSCQARWSWMIIRITAQSWRNTWPQYRRLSPGSCASGLRSTTTAPVLSTPLVTTKARQWRWSGLTTTCLAATPIRAGEGTVSVNCPDPMTVYWNDWFCDLYERMEVISASFDIVGVPRGTMHDFTDIKRELFSTVLLIFSQHSSSFPPHLSGPISVSSLTRSFHVF